MPRATRESRKSRDERGCSSSRPAIWACVFGPVARKVNTPSSTAERNVLDPQKAKPSWRIESGVTEAATVLGDMLTIEVSLVRCREGESRWGLCYTISVEVGPRLLVETSRPVQRGIRGRG